VFLALLALLAKASAQCGGIDMVDGVNQQPGLFQRIGNFFGGDDPNAGQPTDPFAGLSRPQRTMLGFAALRDAAA
jgi:hypothetical protein